MTAAAGPWPGRRVSPQEGEAPACGCPEDTSQWCLEEGWNGPPQGAFQEETFIGQPQERGCSHFEYRPPLSSVELRRGVRNCGCLPNRALQWLREKMPQSEGVWAAWRPLRAARRPMASKCCHPISVERRPSCWL